MRIATRRGRAPRTRVPLHGIRDHLAGLGARAAHVRQLMVDRRLQARAYTRLEGEDAPEIRDWAWPH